ncbi:MAG: NUDIX domain-containing protein [Alphaproteobacteria bacterium]|nr:NUDIX domain-containing protein [Alphaproteobacteria bacterium]
MAKRVPVKILSKQTIYRGYFQLDLYTLRHRLYRGGMSPPMTREVFERGQTVGILLYDPKRDALVLVEQFRLPAHLAGFPAWQIEIVAGIIEDRRERPRNVAVREAREEAGIAITGAPFLAQKFMTSPGGSTESFHLFCARVDSRGVGGLHGLAEEHEDIRVTVKGFRAAMNLALTGRIQNGPTLVALYWLAANRARLRRRWLQR